MDAAEYKHVVLGLIFLKYISDAFEAKHAELEAQREQGADPEDRDEYRADSIFWVPKEARWSHLRRTRQQPTIGKLVDDAMSRSNATTRRSKASCRKTTLALASTSSVSANSSISSATLVSAARQIAPRTFWAGCTNISSRSSPVPKARRAASSIRRPTWSASWSKCSRRTRAAFMIRAAARAECSFSSEKFIEAHGGKIGDISIYGQESNSTTWRLAKMNLAIRGIDAQIAHGDTFHNDRHPDLKADYVLANPPFNDSDWRGELLKEDKRWVYGVPPAGNANFAWVQHFIYHLAPTGLAGFVLANGSMSSNQSGEGEIRKAHRRGRPGGLHGGAARPALLLDADSCLPVVPGPQQEERPLPRPARRNAIHRCPQNGHDGRPRASRAERRGDRRRSPERITPGGAIRTPATMPTCPASAKPKLDDIRKHGHVLTPGRYVGAEKKGKTSSGSRRRCAVSSRR